MLLIDLILLSSANGWSSNASVLLRALGKLIILAPKTFYSKRQLNGKQIEMKKKRRCSPKATYIMDSHKWDVFSVIKMNWSGNES